MRAGSNTSVWLRKGAWTAEEDIRLKNCIEKYGEGKWHLVPLKAGLSRCRKSCRLRWLNYLRPNIKRGDFGQDEVDLMLRLHKLLGNKWSLIAGRIPGRTANDVKNYWNTHLRSRSKQGKEPRHGESPQDATKVTLVKPQPRTFCKTLNWYPHNTTRVSGNVIKSSNDGVDNGYNISPGIISSPGMLDDKINEYLDELFDDREKIIDGGVGWSFGGSPAERQDLDVIEQEDGQNSLFNFPINDGMWDFLDSEQL